MDADASCRVFPDCKSDNSDAFRASSAADIRSLGAKSRGLLRGDGGIERLAGRASRGLPFTGVPGLDRLPFETASTDEVAAAAAATAEAAAIGRLPVLCDARFKRSNRSTPSITRDRRSAAIALLLVGDDAKDCA